MEKEIQAMEDRVREGRREIRKLKRGSFFKKYSGEDVEMDKIEYINWDIDYYTNYINKLHEMAELAPKNADAIQQFYSEYMDHPLPVTNY